MLNYAQQSKWANNFGAQQSPIQIDSTKAVPMTTPFQYLLHTHYALHQLIDDETTMRALGTGNATILGRNFQLEQIHFHAPAEHVIDGQRSPLEIHFVHRNEIGQLLVTALLVTIGAANAQFEKLLTVFQPQNMTPLELDVTDWIDQPNRTGFRYLGSLTTPMLTEGVEWLVLTAPQLTISAQQLKWYQQYFIANDRDLQPLNQRVVYRF